MAENELWLHPTDISALRLACDHCASEAVFAADDDDGPPSVIRCPNCNLPMPGAPRVVQAYRDFLFEVKRQPRGAHFRVGITNG